MKKIKFDKAIDKLPMSGNPKAIQEVVAMRLKAQEGLCPTCGKPVVEPFRNALSLKEFTISGMCQACQDSVFGTD